MKFYIALISLISTTVFADTYVNGYYKSDGTYVEPHYRSSPNNNTLDNYSTRGNVNPYTGQSGTRSQYNNDYDSGNSSVRINQPRRNSTRINN